MNLPRSAELYDYPIVTWTTPTFCLPTVTHVHCTSWHDQIVTMTEEHVAAREYESPIFRRGQIDLAWAFELIPIWYHFAVDAKACDAAVGKNLETKMCDAFVVLDWERIQAIAREGHLRQEWHPLDRVAGQLLFCWQAREGCAFEWAMLRVVTAKVACIDNDATHNSRKAETNNAPIKSGRPASATLPSIHPLATIGVLPLDKNRRACSK